MAGTAPQSSKLVESRTPLRLAAVVLAMWLTVVGIDLVLNAGVFSRVFLRSSPFLLPPRELFVRIPFGYAAFLLQMIFLLWLMAGTRIVGVKAGFRFGLIAGVLMSAANYLGLYSLSTAEPALMAVGFADTTLEFAAGGAMAGAALAGVRARRILLIAIGVLLVSFVTVVMMQNTGLAVGVKR